MSLLRDRNTDALFLGISTGIGYSVLDTLGSLTLAMVLSPYYGPSEWWQDVHSQFTAIVGRGVVLGALYSVLLLITVSSKNPCEVAKWILIVFLPFALLFQVIRDLWGLHSSVPVWFTADYVPSLVFLLLCAILSRLLKGETTATACSRCGRPFDPVCSKCGYNLRGNESGTCPECGAPVAR